MPTPAELSPALDHLAAIHRLRHRYVLDSPQGRALTTADQALVSFASNDYLGLANHPEVIAALQHGAAQWGAGAGASALVNGHLRPHATLEHTLAQWLQAEAGLLFGDGFLANIGVIPALVGRGDAIFADRLNHASLNAAAQLSRAQLHRFHHNDMSQLRHLLANSEAKCKLIAVDAVYSMDGDEAPLADLLQLAEEHHAWLYIDDAHGFGVLGAGKGTLFEQGVLSASSQLPEQVVVMATLGKAAGVAGAVVVGSQSLSTWLENRAATAIYTTAPPPALACALLASLALIRDNTAQQRLQNHIAFFREATAGLPWPILPSRTPIQAVVIGEDRQALAVSQQLRQQGFWVPAIRPPTVPEGSARLRISLSAAHQQADIAALVAALWQIAQS